MFLYLAWTITIITSLLCAIYFVYIAGYCYGWVKTKTFSASAGNPIAVAVIIAARNEEQNIAACLDAVVAQNYPLAYLNVYVVDDHSTDNTKAIILKYAEKHKFLSLISMSGTGRSGKKSAISEAISKTDAELIVTTDADCTMGAEWLRTIASFYSETNAKMIVGPVGFSNEGSFFQKMQSLEMLALVGSTAGSLYYNKAVMCNGANLAYTRKAFEEAEGFRDIDASASGDDVLLMYKIAGQYPQGIRFLKSPEAIVHTAAKSTLSEFVSQRKRWASKGFKALNPATKQLSLLVYFFSFFLLILALLTAFTAIKSTICQPFLNICLILTGIKCIIDFLLLFLAALFFKRKQYLYLFLPEQIIYIFYVVVVGMLGAMKKYEWKGRTY